MTVDEKSSGLHNSSPIYVMLLPYCHIVIIITGYTQSTADNVLQLIQLLLYYQTLLMVTVRFPYALVAVCPLEVSIVKG